MPHDLAGRKTFGYIPWFASVSLVFLPGVAVMCVILFVSLSRWDLTTGQFFDFPTSFGFGDALASGRAKILGQQLTRAFLVSTLDVILAVPAAHFIVRRLRIQTQMTVTALFLVPFFVNSATRAFAWKSVLGHDGPLGAALGAIGASDSARHMFLHNSFSVTLSLMASSIPFALFPILLMLGSLQKNLWQICDDLGLDTSVEFFGIAAPLCWRGSLYGWMISFVIVALSSVEIDFTGGYRDQSLSKVVKGLFDKSEPNAAVALGVCLVVGMVSVLFCLYLVAWFGDQIKSRLILPRIRGFSYVELLFLIAIIGLVVAPGLSVLTSTIYQLVKLHPFSSGFDVSLISISDDRIRLAAVNTLLVCLGVALPTTVGCVMAGLSWWDKADFEIMFLAALCLATIPGETYAIGIYALLEIFHWNLGSFGAIIIAQIAWAFPFCLLTAATGFAGVRKNVLRACEDLGATKLTAFFSVVLLAGWPEIILTVIVGAVLSLNEFSRVYFLNGKNEFLSLYITGRLRSGGDVTDYILASVGILMGLLVVLCFRLCWSRSIVRTVRKNITIDQKSPSISDTLQQRASSAQAGR